MTVAVLGLILLAAAGVLAAAVVTSNTGAVETDLWSITVSNTSLAIVFVTGMLTTLVAVAGIVLLTAGVRRNQRLRQERRVLRRENQRLSRRIETDGSTEDTTPVVYPTNAASTEPRRSLFAPRRTTTTDTSADAGRHGEAGDRVVAREAVATPTEPTSRSS
jgi:hypothetical protein